jgi:hypothetical protein
MNLKKILLAIFMFFIALGIQAQQIFNINMKNSALTEKNRTRMFDVNPQLQSLSAENKGDTLALDFFNDKKYKAVITNVTKSTDGITGITAQITTSPWDYCFISISNVGVSLSAELLEKDEFYSVVQENGQNRLSFQKLSDLQNSIQHNCAEHVEEQLKSSTLSEETKDIIAFDAPESTDAVTLDVMVVYTPAAKAGAENSGGIDNAIDMAMQRANLVMANSNTNVTLNLVHKQEINYTEYTSVNNDLARITRTDDGYGDEVHPLRTQYKADLVVCIINNTATGTAGAGWILSDDQYGSSHNGFSVVQVKNVATSYTMVHEMGHNLGCGHHLNTDSNGLYSYSHGWADQTSQGTKFSTVMTYESVYSPSLLFPRIPYFSDPAISFEGTPIGDAAKANNALTIRKTKKLVAGYSEEIPWMDAFLKDITLSEGALSPAFAPEIKEYTVQVGNEVTEIDVAGITNSQYASVSGNVTNKALAVGSNEITLVVTDGYGNRSNTKTYKINVERSNPTDPTGLPEISKNTMVFYPNPVQAGERIHVLNSRHENMQVDMLDMGGKKLQQVSLRKGSSFIVPASSEKGIYLFILRDNEKIVKREKVVVR